MVSQKGLSSVELLRRTLKLGDSILHHDLVKGGESVLSRDSEQLRLPSRLGLGVLFFFKIEN